MAVRSLVLISVPVAALLTGGCQTGAPYRVPGVAAAPPAKLFEQPDFRSALTTTASHAYGAPAVPVRNSSPFSLSYYANGGIELADIDYELAPLLQSGEDAEIPSGEGTDTGSAVSRKARVKTVPGAGQAVKPAQYNKATTTNPAATGAGGTALDGVFADQPEMKAGSAGYVTANACKNQLSQYAFYPKDQAAKQELLLKWRTCIATGMMAKPAGR